MPGDLPRRPPPASIVRVRGNRWASTGRRSSSSASLDAIVEATLGDTGAEAFRACLAGAGYALTFPHPEGGVVTVKYPLRLEPDYAARESFYVTY